MLAEFERIEAEYGADKGIALRKACRYLVRNQFVWSGDRGVAVIYDILTDGRFRKIIEEYFDCLGYRVPHSPEEQWVGIVLDDEDFSSAPRMRLDETIVALIVAAFWQGALDQGNIGDRGTVVTRFSTLFEHYKDSINRGGNTALTPIKFEETLKSLAQRNLVWVSDRDPEQSDREVVIRPMIRLVAGKDALERLERYARDEEAIAARRAGSKAVTVGSGADASDGEEPASRPEAGSQDAGESDAGEDS
ncbi:DUF4194 domain-containing protein [Pelagibius litoralis]|uniref:DUF4194 domain-containing protein n=1 Tax=Pelagibius litoralis TaxID=374515 RepID=A0A967F0T3_9PROT|nr:DUF4194 domain-containing protein [Pelagibius litoralis]NIA70985.1 DUF4194 domain-containing protein [Pelagibius litoralis]